ncbi:MAG: carbamoyltransferase HypF [Chloroflexi bacterium]|nr:carbamoyltransferase HypF [Chloroflexota bacterium]
MQGLRVHVSGIVQGVGFRPFVYNLALRMKLAGWVNNTSAGVDIHIEGDEAVLNSFIEKLSSEKPPLAVMDEVSVREVPLENFTTFDIQHSTSIEGAFQPISPDVAICDDCLRELFDPADRRYRYPFINCTNCGPRFTIIQDIPYDRPKTTMAGFALCPDCEREYKDPTDRRFHAQPVACSVCGPHVWLEDVSKVEGQKSRVGEDAVQEARRLLAEGKIVAIKGLGGFHLACDATNAKAVTELRNRKLRVDKPFALMMPDLETIERHCFVSEAERALLQSTARPIVLLKRKSESNIVPEVAPGQDNIGIMLPYTPLHYLLLEKATSLRGGAERRRSNLPAAERGLLREDRPRNDGLDALVMTSGNLSEEPIATGNDEARERLSGLADAFLFHNRDIHIRCDDSVVRVFSDQSSVVSQTEHAIRNRQYASPNTYPLSRVYPIRRSRGYSPFPVKLPFDVPQILATGSELKNTFCITNKNYAFLSHHIGDMENYETLKSFEQGVEHFERLFRVKPVAIACDLHPNYLATRYAIERAQRENLSTFYVQHHHAHIAACMAEHGLDGSRPVIGLAFDGTGYGDDGAIWGGEILVADYRGYQRVGQLEYFPLPGGDASIKKPARTALALLWSLGLDWDDRLASVLEFCADDRTLLRTQLEKKINTPMTSSMGRLFDAFAALAGVRQAVNYEAQAAMEFEALADPLEGGKYPFGWTPPKVEARRAVEALVADALAGVPIGVMSARFHNGLAEVCREACAELRQKLGINEVALSGGVWQNITLLRRALPLLESAGFKVYLHREVPTNDGGLSLGQAIVAANRLSD